MGALKPGMLTIGLFGFSIATALHAMHGVEAVEVERGRGDKRAWEQIVDVAGDVGHVAASYLSNDWSEMPPQSQPGQDAAITEAINNQIVDGDVDDKLRILYGNALVTLGSLAGMVVFGSKTFKAVKV